MLSAGAGQVPVAELKRPIKQGHIGITLMSKKVPIVQNR